MSSYGGGTVSIAGGLSLSSFFRVHRHRPHPSPLTRSLQHDEFSIAGSQAPTFLHLVVGLLVHPSLSIVSDNVVVVVVVVVAVAWASVLVPLGLLVVLAVDLVEGGAEGARQLQVAPALNGDGVGVRSVRCAISR